MNNINKVSIFFILLFTVGHMQAAEDDNVICILDKLSKFLPPKEISDTSNFSHVHEKNLLEFRKPILPPKKSLTDLAKESISLNKV